MALYLLAAYVSPKRAVALMELMISSLGAFKNASGEVYFSSNFIVVFVVILEKTYKYCGYTIHNSP